MERDETVTEFYLRVKRLLSCAQTALANDYGQNNQAANNNADSRAVRDFAKAGFIRGLTDELRYGVTLGNPVDLKAAYELATKLERQDFDKPRSSNFQTRYVRQESPSRYYDRFHDLERYDYYGRNYSGRSQSPASYDRYEHNRSPYPSNRGLSPEPPRSILRRYDRPRQYDQIRESSTRTYNQNYHRDPSPARRDYSFRGDMPPPPRWAPSPGYAQPREPSPGWFNVEQPRRYQANNGSPSGDNSRARSPSPGKPLNFQATRRNGATTSQIPTNERTILFSESTKGSPSHDHNRQHQ